jgi:hypothetical protein
MEWDEMLEVAALKHLIRIDCSTSRCASNARGTGRFLRSGEHWYLEVYCPECSSPMHVTSRAADALAHDLMAATPGDRDQIADRWIRARADHRRPWVVP